MATFEVKGLSDLQKFLDKLPAKIEQNVMRGSLRAGLNQIKKAAIENCPTGEQSDTNKRKYKLYNGALRDSIRLSSRIDKKERKIIARVIAGGKSKKTGADVFYAHMIEFGTKPHSLVKGGKGEINHPGILPRPFMRPALDNHAQDAILAAGEYIKKRLKTKHGIDTADINIEIGE